MNNLLQTLPKIAALVLFSVFAVAGAAAQNAKIKISTAAEIAEDLKKVPCKNEERLSGVKALFEASGAAQSDYSSVKKDGVQNFVVAKTGKSGGNVIVGAHYDKAGGGCGAIDNWSGVVMLAHLYRTMRDVPTEKNFLFVAFDREEEGLVGSGKMAKEIPKENRSDYCAMVNLDSFGFTYPQVLTDISSPKMTKLAKTLAGELQLPFSEASLLGVASSDSASFIGKDIPAISFHGLSNDWQKYLHTPYDKIDNLNSSSVFIGYQYVLRYLVKVDAHGCADFRN